MKYTSIPNCLKRKWEKFHVIKFRSPTTVISQEISNCIQGNFHKFASFYVSIKIFSKSVIVRKRVST